MSESHGGPPPAWIPRTGMRTRWDRTLVVREAVFRWHSRLDGTAVVHGPSRVLAVGDRVAMPVGHVHRAGAEVPAVYYVVTAIHEESAEHAWVQLTREPAAA